MNLVRHIVVLEMVLLVASACLLHRLHMATLPPALRLMGLGMLSVVGAAAVSVTVNELSMLPPTPGVYVFAAMVAPATIGGVVLVAQALRDR